MARKPVITYSEIKELLDQGLNQSQVAKKAGVSRAAISKTVTLYGPPKPMTPREKAIEAAYPWDIRPEHKGSGVERVTRSHIDYAYNGSSEGLTKESVNRLNGFYRRLKDFNVVVEYAPDIPPSVSVPSGGFAYQPRKESDGDLIIRVNDYTNLNNDTIKFWRMPDVLP